MIRLLTGLLAAAVVALAACGGGSGRDAGSSARLASPAPTAVATATVPSGQTCVSSGGFAGNVSDHGTAAASGSTLDIDAGDFFFAPTCETGVPSGAVTLVVKNVGGALHNVSIPNTGIDEDVAAGETISVNVEVGAAPIQYFCKYHRTSGMVGALLP